MQVSRFWQIVMLVGSVLFLSGNVLVLHKNYRNEWRAHQTEYLEIAAELTEDAEMRANIWARNPRIEQLIISDWGERRIDRCTTCHAGIDDPKFADAPLPYRTHSNIRGNHPFREFGCTVCHEGNGRGLTAEDAHGAGEHWIRGRLAGDYVQAACAKCHLPPYPRAAPVLRAGSRLFIEKACYGCHRIDGVSRGKLGVELTDVGAKWRVDYLFESIVDPKANSFESIMPTMELTEDEVHALLVYLKAQTGERLLNGPVREHFESVAWEAQGPEDVPVSVESGRQLFESMACVACHTINGEGGKIGPDLSVYGRQRTKEWMKEHHLNPRTLIGGSIMPDFEYSESQLDALELYLESLTTLEVDNATVYAPEGG